MIIFQFHKKNIFKIGYNIFKNKKTIETFINGPRVLNDQGQLSQQTICSNILFTSESSTAGIS
jgi:hypothetical protein